MMGMTQLRLTTTKTMVHQGRETLAVTRTAEVLPTKETLGEDLVEVTEVTAGEEETTGITVDTTEDVAKDGMITVVEAMEVETTTEVGIIGMEIESKMIRETIVTTVTIGKIEDKEKTNNQTDKFCPDL